jgi:hypothetical protein
MRWWSALAAWLVSPPPAPRRSKFLEFVLSHDLLWWGDHSAVEEMKRCDMFVVVGANADEAREWLFAQTSRVRRLGPNMEVMDNRTYRKALLFGFYQNQTSLAVEFKLKFG